MNFTGFKNKQGIPKDTLFVLFAFVFVLVGTIVLVVLIVLIALVILLVLLVHNISSVAFFSGFPQI